MDQLTTQTRHQLPSTPALIKRERCCTLFFVFILISFIVVFNLGGSSESLVLFRLSNFFPAAQKLIPKQQRSSLGGCDYSHGQWVRDEHYPIQLYNESCPFLDPGFRCRQNGREDVEFLKWRWQPHGCDLPRAPFLVIADRPPKDSAVLVRVTIRVDELHKYSIRWMGADVLVFNTGHWWNKEKTVRMGCYFEVGGKVNMTMDVMDGFRRSLQTLKSWTIKHLNPERSHVFFRSYSPAHYTNGTWKGGGKCDAEMEPEKNYKKLKAEPWNNQYVADVINQMTYGNWKFKLLNITYLTEFRKDGHPSRHREPGTPANAPQDCSHWCLPGIPDTWNELLYAHLPI